jgi:hypothetical protein
MTVPHPKHPKCSFCGLSLYKAKAKGSKVKKSDPWAFCRNRACETFGHDQARHAFVVQKGKPPTRARGRRARTRKTVPSPGVPPSAPVEPEAVQKARARIKELVRKLAHGRPEASVGLVLALVNQETGNQKAANALIAEYRLDELFGVKKFDDSTG